MKNKKKEVVLDFELPGFDKKDVKVLVKDGRLTVDANKKSESKVQRDDLYHEEKSFSSFSYSSTLPSVDGKKMKTSFRKGKLKVKLPKK